MKKLTTAGSLAVLAALTLVTTPARPARADSPTAAGADSAPAVEAAATTAGPSGFRLSAAAGPGWFATADGVGDGHAGLGTGIALSAEIRTSRHIGLGADFELVGADGFRQYTGAQTFGVNVWPIERLWLRGGLGFGFSRADAVYDPFDQPGLGPAAMAAAGFELVRRPTWSFEIQARTAAVIYNARTPIATGGLLLGVAWR